MAQSTQHPPPAAPHERPAREERPAAPATTPGQAEVDAAKTQGQSEPTRREGERPTKLREEGCTPGQDELDDILRGQYVSATLEQPRDMRPSPKLSYQTR
jgi:hypothetical protein